MTYHYKCLLCGLALYTCTLSLQAYVDLNPFYQQLWEDLKSTEDAPVYDENFSIHTDSPDFANDATSGRLEGKAEGINEDNHKSFSVRLYVASDIDYLVTSTLLKPDGTWQLSFSIGTPAPKVLKLFNLKTREIAAEYYLRQGIIRSYNTTHYILARRCFTYDQSLAIMAAVNQNDRETADRWVNALVDMAFPEGHPYAHEIPFFVKTVSGYKDEPDYYRFRTGAQMWCAYSLAYYLWKYGVEGDTNERVCKALTNLLDTLVDEYWVSEDNAQKHSFLFGKGALGIPELAGAASAEHNIDAAHTYILAGKVLNQVKYMEKGLKVLDALGTNFWNEQTNRAYQGRGLLNNPNRYDTAHALDTGSWYAIVMYYAGRTDLARKALDSVSIYAVTENNEPFDQLIGYSAYSSAEGNGYEETIMPWWGEGTAGVILARMMAGEWTHAFELMDNMRKAHRRGGILYVTQDDLVFEMSSYVSVASTAWALLSARPRGFLGADVPDLISDNIQIAYEQAKNKLTIKRGYYPSLDMNKKDNCLDVTVEDEVIFSQLRIAQGKLVVDKRSSLKVGSVPVTISYDN